MVITATIVARMLFFATIIHGRPAIPSCLPLLSTAVCCRSYHPRPSILLDFDLSPRFQFLPLKLDYYLIAQILPSTIDPAKIFASNNPGPEHHDFD
jgi:hypothetical protein